METMLKEKVIKDWIKMYSQSMKMLQEARNNYMRLKSEIERTLHNQQTATQMLLSFVLELQEGDIVTVNPDGTYTVRRNQC